MIRCPYPETLEEDNIELPNDKYLIWGEGYESHKFELANQTLRVALLAQGLEDEIKKFKQLEADLLAKAQLQTAKD